MSVCIVGAGLAGLSTAIKIKLDNPDIKVTVIDKIAQQSNTQMAGMRLQIGDGVRKKNMVDELASRIALRNNQTVTHEIQQFARLSIQEVEFWQNLPKKNSTFTEPFPFHTDPLWFGPQWGNANASGKARGVNLLKYFRENAEKIGIEFKKADAEKIIVNHGYIEGLIAKNYEKSISSEYVMIKADAYILAGGNAGGSMFESTNREIRHSPQELALDAGFSIIDSTNFMFHPFGKCTDDGMPILCCFETDAISDMIVYFRDNTIDHETTRLLKEHSAHYHFGEIAKRFYEHGSVVTLRRDGQDDVEYARLSHHYSHIAIQTEENGVKVAGAENLYAVGDAAGVGRRNNHKVRIPGTALTNCLVDAEIVREKIAGDINGSDYLDVIVQPIDDYSPKFTLSDSDRRSLRKINTEKLFAIQFGIDTNASEIIDEWKKELLVFPECALVKLSIGTANSFEQLKNNNAVEPIPIQYKNRVIMRQPCNDYDHDLHLMGSLI